MTTRFIIFLVLATSAVSLFAARSSSAPVELRCEYLVNPQGIDEAHPRLMWRVESAERGAKQTAYQVIVASRPELLDQSKGDLWDSGQINSDQSIQLSYAGTPLKSGQSCYWKVRVWDERGQPSAWSHPAAWSMGLLAASDWHGQWIGLDETLQTPTLTNGAWIWHRENPEALGKRDFRKRFEVPTGRVINSAKLFTAADNQAVISLNGEVVARPITFSVATEADVTGSLRSGANWFTVSAENGGDAPNPAGLLVVLRVEFAEGPPLIVTTDSSWRSAVSETNGWEPTGFHDSAWLTVTNFGPVGVQPWGPVSLPENRRLPARYLRREFSVEKKVARATAYVCGLGFFELYLNGRKVSDQVMNPALSDYRKAAYYVTIDITDQVKRGRNALGVILGNGRFFAPRLRTPVPTVDYGYPKLRLQTEILYNDGTTQEIVSDENWMLTAAGPIRANNEYDGEEYDARMEMPGWCQAGFDDSKWKKARPVAAPGGSLSAQMLEPMRVTQVLKPVGITNPKPGIFVVDFGQNFYGAVRMKAKRPRGTEVRMVCAYSLLPDGMLKTADNRGAKATDIYVFKGEGKEIWSPQFKGQGLRRVQVTGFPGTPTVDNFEGLVVHTDVNPVGEFVCSNDLVNRIHQAMRWGMRMFLRSAPLDPDRDERQAWLGDPAKDAESEAFNFDVAAFYSKWMADIRRSQRADGTIPDVSMNWEWGNGVEWPSVYTIIPDWCRDFYADGRLLETHYDPMKRWVQAMQQQNQQADGTLKNGPYADWCDAASMDGGKDSGATSASLISTAYHYNNCRIMARAAQQLDKPADEKLFTAWAEQLRVAFNQKFFDPAANQYQGGTQCSYLLPLAFGLVPPEHRMEVSANLADDILVKHQGHLSVGLIGMQWLMQTLTDIGRSDVAWKIVTQTTRPSWGYMLSKGATTIWERWDCDTRDPGMNSEALLIQAGNLDAWFYQTLAGINYDPKQPGFKHILLRPQPVGDLKWVKAAFRSSYGTIRSDWKIKGGKFRWKITVPPNTTATVWLPASEAAAVHEGGKALSRAAGVKILRVEAAAVVCEVSSGHYEFEMRGQRCPQNVSPASMENPSTNKL